MATRTEATVVINCGKPLLERSRQRTRIADQKLPAPLAMLSGSEASYAWAATWASGQADSIAEWQETDSGASTWKTEGHATSAGCTAADAKCRQGHLSLARLSNDIQTRPQPSLRPRQGSAASRKVPLCCLTKSPLVLGHLRRSHHRGVLARGSVSLARMLRMFQASSARPWAVTHRVATSCNVGRTVQALRRSSIRSLFKALQT